MGLISSEAQQFNRIKTLNIEQGRFTFITCYEEGRKAILNYRENGQFKIKQKQVNDLTPNMLKEMQKQIDGRPTMGNVDEKDVYIRDEDR